MRGLFLTVAVVVAGCSSRPAWKPSGAMETSARMLKQLDRLEADLHGAEGENLTYGVLVERHAHAEQIACNVTEKHVEDIERLQAIQERKIVQKREARAAARRKRNAVAQLATGRTRS